MAHGPGNAQVCLDISYKCKKARMSAMRAPSVCTFFRATLLVFGVSISHGMQTAVGEFRTNFIMSRSLLILSFKLCRLEKLRTDTHMSHSQSNNTCKL